MDINGLSTVSNFDGGVKTDVISNVSGSSKIDINTNSIDFVTSDLTLNGVEILTSDKALSNPFDGTITANDFSNNSTTLSQIESKTQNLEEKTQNIISSVFSTDTVFNNALECTGRMLCQGLSVNMANPPTVITLNGAPTVIIGNVLIDSGNINLQGNNITGFGFGQTQTLNGLNNTVSVNLSSISELQTKTANISNVMSGINTEFIGDILSSNLSNSNIGSVAKPFENLYLNARATINSLITTAGNVIHGLANGNIFSVGDAGFPFGLLYFSINSTQILSQIKHAFTSGLEPLINSIGDIGTSLKWFNTLWVNNVVSISTTAAILKNSGANPIIVESNLDFLNTKRILNCRNIIDYKFSRSAVGQNRPALGSNPLYNDNFIRLGWNSSGNNTEFSINTLPEGGAYLCRIIINGVSGPAYEVTQTGDKLDLTPNGVNGIGTIVRLFIYPVSDTLMVSPRYQATYLRSSIDIMLTVERFNSP